MPASTVPLVIVKRVTQVALTRTTEPPAAITRLTPAPFLWRVEWTELRNGKPAGLRQSHYTEAAARRHVDGLLAMLTEGANTGCPLRGGR